MNGRQEILRVISLFDMEKVNLPSFNLSRAKFEEVSHTYAKIMLLASLVALESGDKSPDGMKRKEIALSTINKLVQNSNAYGYEVCAKSEREVVNRAMEDILGVRRDNMSKEINRFAEKSQRKLMVKNLGYFIDALKQALEIYPDELLDKYLDDEVFEGILDSFRNITHQQDDVNTSSCEGIAETDADCQSENDELPVDNCAVYAGEEKKPSLWGRIISNFKR